MAEAAAAVDEGNVVPLARAREVSKKKPGPSTSSFSLRRSPEFDALVRLLELAEGVRLNGWGLGQCLAHFAADRGAFASCTSRALDLYRAGESYRPLSKLCKMAERREDYRLPEATAAELAELERPPDATTARRRPATKYGRRAVSGAEVREDAERLRREESGDAGL